MNQPSFETATKAGKPIRHGPVTQALHWITVLVFIVLVYLAMVMTDLPTGFEKFKLYNWHKSLGLTVLALMLARLAWRRISPPPPLPGSLSALERRLANGAHHLLYTLVILQALIGIGHSWVADFPILIYGLFSLPNPLGPVPAAGPALAEAHHFLGWGIVGLILLHAAAALRHHFLLKDEILARMVPGLAPPRPKDRGGE